MRRRLALKLDSKRKLLLLTASLATGMMPIPFNEAGVAQPYAALDLNAAASRSTRYESLLRVASPMQIGADGGIAPPEMPDWQKAAGGKMEFETASIRLTKAGEFTPSLFSIGSDDSYPVGHNDSFIADSSLLAYIQFAYKVRLSPDQRKALLAEEPTWVTDDKYQIRAKASRPVTKDQLRLMMQALLADRFKLTLHSETRDSPVLALVLTQPGKLGPKLVPHSHGPSCKRPSKIFPNQCESYDFVVMPDHTLMGGSRDTTVGLLAANLNSFPGVTLAHTVIDRTELSGSYDFTLEWAPEPTLSESSEAGTQSASQGPTFDNALKDQLGLGLQSTHAPEEFLIIDHVEKPSLD